MATRGGVALDGINQKTMESKIVPNLYCIGRCSISMAIRAATTSRPVLDRSPAAQAILLEDHGALISSGDNHHVTVGLVSWTRIREKQSGGCDRGEGSHQRTEQLPDERL